MSCTLDRYTSYEVKDVVRVDGRQVVHLLNPPASCPDGTLNNSKTRVLPNAQVEHPTLQFSPGENRPIVLMPRGTEAVVLADSAQVRTSHGTKLGGFLFTFAVISVMGAVAFIIWRRRTETRWRRERVAAGGFTGGEGLFRPPRGSYSRPHLSGYREPGAPTTVIHNRGGSGVASFAAGALVGHVLTKEHESHPGLGTDYVPPAPSPSYGSDSASTYSSDSDSSYSSDAPAASSFGSDNSPSAPSTFGDD